MDYFETYSKTSIFILGSLLTFALLLFVYFVCCIIRKLFCKHKYKQSVKFEEGLINAQDEQSSLLKKNKRLRKTFSLPIKNLNIKHEPQSSNMNPTSKKQQRYSLSKPLIFSSLNTHQLIIENQQKLKTELTHPDKTVEPMLAKQLRLSIRAVLNFNEYSPEALAITELEKKTNELLPSKELINKLNNKLFDKPLNLNTNLPDENKSSETRFPEADENNSYISNKHSKIFECGDYSYSKCNNSNKQILHRTNSEKDTNLKKSFEPLYYESSKFTPLKGEPMPKSNNALHKSLYSNDKHYEFNIPAYGKLKFTDHCPMVFKVIRESLNYQVDDLTKAFSLPFFKILKTAGKSESLFFLLDHGKNCSFLLKTLRYSEPVNLRNFLPSYVEHLKLYPNTLLPKYLGWFTIEKVPLSGSENVQYSSPLVCTKPENTPQVTTPIESNPSKRCSSFPMAGQKEVSKDEEMPSKMIIVLMSNVFETDLQLNEKYDFKGANVGRKTIQTPTLINSYNDIDISQLTLKEMDFQSRLFTGKSNLIHLGSSLKEKLLSQLEIDLAILRQHEFMDYSLLVGIHKKKDTPVSRGSLANKSPIPNPHTDNNASDHRINIKITDANDEPNKHKVKTIAGNLIGNIAIKTFRSRIKNMTSINNKEDCAVLPKTLLRSTSHSTFWNSGTHSNVSLSSNNSHQCSDFQEVYFFGIIDILQKYTLTKRIEKGIRGANVNMARLLLNNNTGNNIPGSGQSSQLYFKHHSNQASISSTSNSIQQIQIRRPSDSKLANDKDTLDTNEGPSKKPLSINSEFQLIPEQLINKQYEVSVEEPNRYASRLVDYVKGIVI